MNRSFSVLEIGCLIIGVIELLAGVVGVIFNVVGLVVIAVVKNQLVGEKSEDPNSGGESDEEFRLHGSIAAQWICSIVSFIYIIFLVICCIQVIISSVLIHGIKKKSTTLMTVWTIFKVISIVVLVAIFISSYCFFEITLGQVALFLGLLALNAFYIKVIHHLSNRNESQMEAEEDDLPIYMKLPIKTNK